MAEQPGPPQTRQSGPESRPAPRDALHQLKPGGPILESEQGSQPGPHERGIEHNTSFHKGTPNPEQHGSHGPIGDYVHDPGMGQAGEVHRPRVPEVSAAKERTADKSTKVAPPEPDPRGVRK